MKRILLALIALAPFTVWAECDFKADTASQEFLIGPFLDSTDGTTAETGLTISNTDIRISKGGANIAAKNSGGGTHDENGMYQVTFDATDTDTEGTFQIQVFETGAVPVWHDCLVLGADEYDRKYGTVDNLSSLDTGLVTGPTDIATLASQVSFTITDGPTNDDALNEHVICFIGGTEKDCSEVDDYTGSTKTVTLTSAPEFTIAVSDIVRVFRPGGADNVADTRTDVAAILTDTGTTLDNAISAMDGNVDLILADTGTDGVVIANDGITAAKIAADAIGASELAADSITAAEIAADAIGAAEIAASAIGASELATDAIGASELAADASAEIWGIDCEDQNGGISCRETMSLLLSEAMGTCVYTSGTRTFVCSDPSGTETRFTLVYGTDLDGDRTTSTPAPATF